MNIDEIIINSILRLEKDFPNAVQEIIREGCFVTAVKRYDKSVMVIVDFTQPMIYDKQRFINHSAKLYYEFCPRGQEEKDEIRL